MTPTNYKPLTSSALPGCASVTNYGWCTGGSKSSTDNYRTYTISVFKHWHVYRHKPKWFGQYPGDRYLGKLRWISQHADGKQWKFITQYGDLNGVVINAGDEKSSDRIAHQLLLARGYNAYHLNHLRREYDWYLIRERTKEIRCTECKLTRAEHLRRKSKMEWELAYPAGDFRKRMEFWNAQQIARTHCMCKCDVKPLPEELERLHHSLETGDGLKLN